MNKAMLLGAALLAMTTACSKSQSQDATGAGGNAKITLAQFQQRRVDQMMKADADGDGKISKGEFLTSIKQRFADRGQDVDDPDMAARFDQMFARQDKNGDGFITKDEIQNSAAEQFARLDVDHKGYVTRDEIRQRFRGGPGGPGGGGPDGGPGGQGGGEGGGPRAADQSSARAASSQALNSGVVRRAFA
jgi:parvulin-like peptidyl-prolyl isomerase